MGVVWILNFLFYLPDQFLTNTCFCRLVETRVSKPMFWLKLKIFSQNIGLLRPVANSGFSWGGGADSQKYIILYFFFLPKPAWKSKNLDPHGGVPGAPLWSANVYPLLIVSQKQTLLWKLKEMRGTYQDIDQNVKYSVGEKDPGFGRVQVQYFFSEANISGEISHWATPTSALKCVHKLCTSNFYLLFILDLSHVKYSFFYEQSIIQL